MTLPTSPGMTSTITWNITPGQALAPEDCLCASDALNRPEVKQMLHALAQGEASLWNENGSWIFKPSNRIPHVEWQQPFASIHMMAPVADAVNTGKFDEAIRLCQRFALLVNDPPSDHTRLRPAPAIQHIYGPGEITLGGNYRDGFFGE